MLMTLKEKAKDKRLYKTYGITLVTWTAMYRVQAGVCYICKTIPKSKILCVDHMHVKGFKKMAPEEKKKYVRALLCFQCNTAFGRIERRKNPRELLSGIIDYFSNYPIKGDPV